jgi:hypothetical protein
MHKIKALLVGLLIGVVVLMIGTFLQDNEGVIDTLAAPNIEEILEPPPAGTFNVQIRALEVTQGVRGEIPWRTAPGDSLTLIMDGATHVADRRTVVRAYPWISLGANTLVPALTAQLWAYRDGELLPGSPISPMNAFLENIAPGRTQKELRSDASLSWNFVLPSEWIAANPLHEPFTLRFLIEANPAGPNHIAECQGCSVDNQIVLGEQTFVHVPPIKIKPYLVDHTFIDLDGNEVSYPGPTLEAFYKALETVHQLFPIADGEEGIAVLSPEYIAWYGAVRENGEHVFAESMIHQYLPGGVNQENDDGVYYLFLFSPSFDHRNQVNMLFEDAKTGLAWIGLPYLQAGARGYELVHELAHAIGLDHAGNQHGEASSDPDYPDDYGRVEANAYGFDVWAMQAIPPVSDHGATHDFMSYKRSQPNWVSIYTWKKLAHLLGQPGL